jgi:hypothetical protein
MIRIPNWLNPWRRIAQLERENARLVWEVGGLTHALHGSNERYDRIRDANVHLRETLTLYRDDAAGAIVPIEYTPRISGWPHNDAGTIRRSEPLPDWTPWPTAEEDK